MLSQPKKTPLQLCWVWSKANFETLFITEWFDRTGACGANIASQLGHLCGNLGQGAEQPPEQPSRSEESPGPTVDRGAVSTTPVTSVERLDDGHDGPGLSRNKRLWNDSLICHQMSPSDINIKASVTDSQIAAAIEICANPGHSKRRLCQHLYGNSWRPSKNQNPSESNFKSFKSSIARRCTCTCNGSPFPMYSHQWWPSQKCRERCRLLGDGTVPVPG